MSYLWFGHHIKKGVGGLREQWQDWCRWQDFCCWNFTLFWHHTVTIQPVSSNSLPANIPLMLGSVVRYHMDNNSWISMNKHPGGSDMVILTKPSKLWLKHGLVFFTNLAADCTKFEPLTAKKNSATQTPWLTTLCWGVWGSWAYNFVWEGMCIKKWSVKYSV